tara:strand:+ start:18156 stop:18368 length:213 start_codon:yes stop_codon:yes gene_type:complete
LIKKSQKIKKKQSFRALCLNASNSIKVKTTSAFNELLSICPFTAFAGSLFFQACAFLTQQIIMLNNSLSN